MVEKSVQAVDVIRVGVADKSPLIQAALKQILSEDERFRLVQVSSGCDEFLENLAKERIDVAVIGWVFGACDGRLILDRVHAQENQPRIVVYSGLESSTLPARVMAHGGAAFVSKSEQPSVLLDTIAEVAEGRMVFPFIDVRTLYDNPLVTLTRRELEVLSNLAAGQTNKQIARDMSVSLNTVKFHLRNIFQKLRVNSRAQAIAMYLRS